MKIMPDRTASRGLRAACTGRGTATSSGGGFGEVVLEEDKDFPLVAVGVMDPRLVLRGIAAVWFHLVAGDETGVDPGLSDAEDIVGRGDLNAQVRERARLAQTGDFVEREIQRWILNVELGIGGACFGRFEPEHVAVERNALGHVADVDRDMSLEGDDFVAG